MEDMSTGTGAQDRENLDVALFPDRTTVAVLPAATGGGDPRGALWRMPTLREAQSLGLAVADPQWSVPYATERSLTGVMLPRETTLPRELHRLQRRGAARQMDIDEAHQMNRVFHLTHWTEETRFCGSCGAPMEWHQRELARTCSQCHKTIYPRLSPAVIMAVVKDGKLLLAHSHRHRAEMYSVLAGFVEPGENLEVAVAREVYEEVGLLVRNVTYFSSQPWPFPDALMVAFTAEYAGGSITLDQSELAEAGWFAPGELPAVIPDTASVARRLIEWFVATYGTRDELTALLNRESV